MVTELCEEIHQSRPFDTPEQEAHLELMRTAASLDHAFTEAIRPWGITPTQYNVLRILRGAGEAGLCRNEVRDRMLTRVPDATRLLDRMEAAGLIERQRNTEDRRYVNTHISDEGLRLLTGLDQHVLTLHREHLGHLGEEKLNTLIHLLRAVRGAL